MISTAHCEQGQLNISTNVVLPWFPFPPLFFFRVFSRPSERIGFIFTGAFMLGCFGSATFPPSLLFDLAPFEWETGPPEAGDAPACLCMRVPLSLCAERECQEDAWTLGPCSCGKISQEAPPPPSFLHPAGRKERRKASGYFTNHFTEAWGGACNARPNTGWWGAVSSLLSFRTPGSGWT